MLTKNYKNWTLGIERESGDGYTYAENMKNIKGNVDNLRFGTDSYGRLDTTLNGTFSDSDVSHHTFEYITKNHSASIFVGTGQREESQEDFMLESMVADSELTILSAGQNFTEDKFIFTKTFAYIGVNDIIISEVAFYKTITTYGIFSTYCLAREKVPPLTVKTGDTFTVTMVIG